MKRFLLLTLFVGILLCRVEAQTDSVVTVTDYKKVLVWTEEGSCTTWLCADHPVVHVAGNEIVLSANGTQARFPADRILAFTFPREGDDQSGVEEMQIEASVLLTPDRLEINGLPKDSPLSLCDLSGRVYFSGKATGDHTVIHLTGMPQGVYVVKTSVSNFKFQKR